MKKRTGFTIVAALLISLLIGCTANQKTKFNIEEYLKLADTETLYPSAAQIEMLKEVIPKHSFQPAPSIKDRKYWSKIAASGSGKEYLDKALSEFEKEPEVPISDEIYRRANKEGNRGIYKPRYYRTMERLENFILAECIENEGRFLPQIETYIRAIMDMKSWLHPNHDTRDNDVLEGRIMAIDLGARKFGTDLALAEVLLEEKLSDDLRQKMSVELQRRIIDFYLGVNSGKVKTYQNWFRGSNNWNAVCASGSMFVVISTSENADDRLGAVGSAINGIKYFIDGFGDDGYCSEGTGYWNYGFGHYLYMAQLVYDYTDGQIDMFEYDNPQKMKNIGNFPERYQIQNGAAAPFSDGSSRVSNNANFASIMSSLHLGASKPKWEEGASKIISDEAAYQLIAWQYPEVFTPDSTIDSEDQELADYTYFDEFGMAISRGKQTVPFSIAIKAGHNNENHNHMDVGTYSIVLGSDHVAGDIGAPSYIAGAFSDNNPARSSWGHPVPRIDNKLQSKGRAFSGKITTTEFTEGYDKVVLDIKAAYDLPSLTTLIRTMENDKSGLGVISIKDEFELSEPLAFGTAIMTLSEYEIVDANTIIMTSDNQKIKAEVLSEGGTVKITDELVPVKNLREGGPAYRIGVDFIKPIQQGSITIKFTPVE